jgi:hypothetical protein
LPIRPTWQTSGSPPGRLHTFPILLAAGQDHSVVINDLKHMPGKLFNSPLATACFNFGFSRRCRSQTRDTVNVSLDLLTTMEASQQLFGTIQNMRIPAIVPINSDELRSAFERLTAQMQGS